MDNQKETETLWSNPIPTPDFVYSPPLTVGTSIDPDFDMCIGVREAILFDPGDDNGITYRNIQKTVLITVDSKSVQTMVYSDILLLSRVDKDGNYLGSHGGVDNVCFDLPQRETGFYLALIQVWTTSGRKFEHKWAIKI